MSTYKVIEAPPGIKVFDTISHITGQQAVDLKKAGFDLAMLYAEVVSAGDLLALTAAGIMVGFIQEGLAAKTVPTADLGKTMGSFCSGRLRNLGVPQGVSISIDLEGDGRPPEAWLDFGNGSADAMEMLGDLPGLYIGEGCGLTSEQLYSFHGFPYWKGMSRVTDAAGNLAEPKCGWAMVQQYPDDLVIAGVRVDVSVLGKDYWNRTFNVITAP